MQMEQLIKIIKSGSFVIPNLLLSKYKKLGLDSEGLLILSYLINNQSCMYNPKEMSLFFGMEQKQLLHLLNQLVELDLVSIQVMKNEKGIMEERISLDHFYHKLAMLLIGEKEPEKKNTIYEVFEQELGRTLSPMEYELMNAWHEQGHSEEMVIQALKEAVFSGVNNFRYIDKILFEWQKKGYKKPADIIPLKKPKSEKKILDVPDYNWLDEHD